MNREDLNNKDLNSKNLNRKYVNRDHWKTRTRSLLGLGLCAGLLVGMLASQQVSIKAWELDTSIEASRDAGTDLYESTKGYPCAKLTLSSSEGKSTAALLDANYNTSQNFTAGSSLTVSSETPLKSLYVVWDSLVPEWTMTIDGASYTFGQNGYLHEYVKLPVETKELTITIPDGASLGTDVFGRDYAGAVKGGMRIADLYGIDTDSLPAFVQTWEPSLTEADILYVSTHADDEHIFFGSILPLYQGEKNAKVQVAYFTEHWDYSADSKMREHEKLNGLWVAGAKYYPILGNFKDSYSENLADAEKVITREDATLFLTQTIRQTKPLVLVLHDKDGEYGHGQHILNSFAGVTAADTAANPDYDADSANLYGTWNTPKVYLHLWKDNQLTFDMRSPLSSFGGKTGIQVARQAFLCHESQQYTKFTVDDYGQYQNNVFGLYDSKVGVDKKHNDFLENLTEDVSGIRAKAAAPLAEGTVTATPIYCAEDLALLDQDNYGSFLLMNDIDMTGIDWKPVDFYGSFDGNGYALLNLKVSSLNQETRKSYDGNMISYDSRYGGFFGILSNATVSNLTLLGVDYDVTADGDSFLGGIAGYAFGSTITNCRVEGSISLKVTGKMFGVGGFVGCGGDSVIKDSSADVTLINIDLDKENKDEQFMGGAFATGFLDMDNCQIKLAGYTSDHGYVHDGGITGMYLDYNKSKTTGFLTNNTITGFIRFFEDNADRRAYCKGDIGEIMTWSFALDRNQIDFLRDEVMDYSSDLYPHTCSNPSYTEEKVAGDCVSKSYGYTVKTCTSCNAYSVKCNYELLPHQYALDHEITAPDYENEGVNLMICSLCGDNYYQKVACLERPVEEVTEPSTEASEPEKEEGTPIGVKILLFALSVVLFFVLFILLVRIAKTRRRRYNKRG